MTKTTRIHSDHTIFESGQTSNPLDEILFLLHEISPHLDEHLFRKVHTDIARFYSGKHHLFQTRNIVYHTLRHTHMVVLAVVRLLHGLHHGGFIFSTTQIEQSVLSAYFHDIGMLQRPGAQSGPKIHLHHESHSATILNTYLEDLNISSYSKTFREECRFIISCTNLDWHPETPSQTSHFTGKTSSLATCGRVVATADILAQMADRYYVESLPLLFEEKVEFGISEHPSAVELMRRTVDFHENIIKRRLEITLGDLSPAMRTHFRVRWGIDKNLYLENITLNLKYLQKISAHCGENLTCWKKYLRRKPPKDPPDQVE